MRRLKNILVVELIVVFLFGQMPPETWAAPGRPSAAVDATGEDVNIFLVDRSESMAHLPEPDTIQAAINEALQVAILSGRPAKMAVIIFNGRGVKILGDDQDMPMSALKSLHKRLFNEWPTPDGGTPLDEALQHCARMVKSLPAAARITIVNAGDGQPSSGRLRPDDFSDIQKEMERQLKGIQSQSYPPGILQQLVDQRQRAWKDPTTEEFRKLYALQIKAEFDACLRHAAVLKGRKVRFVSLDFVGQLDELRQIHDAAGGTAEDYAVVRPANTAVKRIHDLGLTRLDGVIVPPPVHVPADAASFECQIQHSLDRVGEAALVTVLFHQAIPRFPEQVELSIDAGGVPYRFDVQNQDPNVILTFDAAGNVTGATLALEQDATAVADRLRDLGVISPTAGGLFCTAAIPDHHIVDLPEGLYKRITGKTNGLTEDEFIGELGRNDWLYNAVFWQTADAYDLGRVPPEHAPAFLKEHLEALGS
ncbi:MAG: VWA domain-containing protein [Planctomycetota bacterium]|nr:VWA domain-containing protein [Planctomycetota bacterium]